MLTFCTFTSLFFVMPLTLMTRFYSKLKYIISSSVTEACNNSVLLLGARGCGKMAVRHNSLFLDWLEYLDDNDPFILCLG